MKEIKKYTNIVRYGHKTTVGVLQEGDFITISEKMDGANTSFRIDEDSPMGVSCYSRKQRLSEENRLRGYYGWVESKIAPIKDKLNPNYVYYGEWLVSHRIQYKPEVYNNFYMFSIWDVEKEQYLSDEIVKSEAQKLGVATVPYLYEGEYISFEHLKSFVGKSQLTLVPDTGEGIVVKNVKHFDRYGKQIFVKLVTDEFAEVQKQKPAKDPNKYNELDSLIRTVLTPARVEKIILKQVDEGLLDEDYDISQMGTILKLIGKVTIDDIMKEEADTFDGLDLDVVKKRIGKLIPFVVKDILARR